MPPILLRARPRRNKATRTLYFMPWLFTCMLLFKISSPTLHAHDLEDAYIDDDLLTAKLI